MAEHYWVFGWFALIAGAVALVAGLLVGGPSGNKALNWPISLVIVWLIASIALFIASFHIGALTGVDFIAARGYFLGTAGGLILAWLARRIPRSERELRASFGGALNSRTLAPTLIGGATALVAAGRLWLTHGEVSGLAALAQGAAVTILSLVIAPALIDQDDAPGRQTALRAGSAALLLVVCLDMAVQLGFTRAGAMKDMFWADIPLLLAAALSLGSLVSTCLPARTRAQALPPILILLAAGALAAIPLSAKVASSWEVAGLTALGAAVIWLAVVLPAGPIEGDRRSVSSHALLAGILLFVAGATVAFALWSGYGLALFVMGGWFTCSWRLFRADSEESTPDRSDPAGLAIFAFGALLLIYRLATLLSGSGIRSAGPGDIWDLFAIALGVALPWMVSEWTTNQAEGRALPASLLTLQWLIATILPAIILEYVWRPRSLAALFVGMALAQMLGAVATFRAGRLAALGATSLLFALTLFGFLPWIGESASPTRAIRVVLILVLAALVILRVLLPARAGSVSRPATSEVG